MLVLEASAANHPWERTVQIAAKRMRRELHQNQFLERCSGLGHAGEATRMRTTARARRQDIADAASHTYEIRFRERIWRCSRILRIL